MTKMIKWCAMGAACILLAGEVAAQTNFKTIRVANGVSGVLYVTHAPGDFKRAFIVLQGSAGSASVRILDLATNTLLATPYITITGLATGGERGLLGFAFHPDYDTNGFVYASFTNAAGHSEVVRYTRDPADPNRALPTTAFKIINQNQPFSNHNGGWIGFGPDGFLYFALGDGGSANDPQGNGQNINTLLGKMLRLDIDKDDFPAPELNYGIPAFNPFAAATPGRDEIWAYGLRNHWRNSFDRMTGDLWIGDVGQGSWEEINFQKANDPGAVPGDPAYQGGKNYGWRCMEGKACTGLSGCTCNATTLTLPVWDYSSASNHCSVTGGYVYRGCAIPELQGHYLFADYCSAMIWSVKYSGSGPITPSQIVDRTAQLAPGGGLSIASITSFGEDAYGEIYICDQGGEVFKIVPVTPTPDCNANGKVDACDILDATSPDANANGVPDECEECYADCDADGSLTIDDFICFQTIFAIGDPAADCDEDGVLTIDDFICFQTVFALGC
jgi:glucose/arabinose dehydrogenase